MPVAESDGTKRAGQQATALRRTLHERGLRMTPQRQLVLDAVRALGHATPEQVCTQVQREAPAVNITTVYRSLDLLERLGLVRHTHLGHGAPNYSVHEHEHVHLVCHGCGTVTEVPPDVMSGLAERLAAEAGFALDVTHVALSGHCRDCQDRDDRDRARRPRRHRCPDPDSAVPAHRGDFLAEQRAMARTAAVVDRSHRGVLAVPGDDRLTWLHLLLTQHVSELPDGAGTEALVLDLNGRVLHHAVVAHVGGTVWLDTEPGDAPVLLDYLEKMRFWSKVEPRDATDELAVLSVVGPDTPAVLDRVGAPLPGARICEWRPAGRWARAPDAVARHGRRGPPRSPRRQGRLARPARRGRRAPGRDDGVRGVPGGGACAAAAPRHGRPHDPARGRLDPVGRAPDQGLLPRAGDGRAGGEPRAARPRRMVLLHLDAGDEELPAPGDPVLRDGRAVGRVGSVAQHHELGPVALALVKRSVPVDAELIAGVDDRATPARIDPDSVPPDDGTPPPGRAAQLRGGLRR